MEFHAGEIEVQTQAGVREAAQRLCSVLSPEIKPAAQEFLKTQQLAIASTVDPTGKVWASLLTGSPGFVNVVASQTAEIDGNISPNELVYQNLQSNADIGLLIIDLSTRRRLRINGKAIIQSEKKIRIATEQVFFNCPKYIQIRHLETVEPQFEAQPHIQAFTALTDTQQHWIHQIDTFFIASAHPDSGVDASHRGGYPGFVRVLAANRLLFPDYSGNNMFQTLGNLAINPKAGLLFIDFERGNTLQLTGTAQIIWNTEGYAEFAGAQRLVEFAVEQILNTTNATLCRWRFVEYSPANPHS